MRILYGVTGEGMGHATRSRVILEHLLRLEHEVKVVVSGRAHKFLAERLAQHANASVEEIAGLHLRYESNAVRLGRTVLSNLEDAPLALVNNIEVYARVAEDGFHPDVVFSDFESWAHLYGVNHRIPVISIDNMQIINRCSHDAEATSLNSFDFQLAKLAVKIKIPGAYHYLVTSFFFPPVRKKRTTLVPPILRPEILAAQREPGEHVLVYQTSDQNEALVPTLQKLPYSFRVYGMGREGTEGNVTLCAFSETGFVDDLRTARAVVAGGGFSLMGEAVHLHVPMLSIPIRRQFEQGLNARYLEKLGYGSWSDHLDADVITAFLEKTDEYAHALSSYPSQDNTMMLTCVDELVRCVSLDEPRPNRLECNAMGKYVGRKLRKKMRRALADSIDPD